MMCYTCSFVSIEQGQISRPWQLLWDEIPTGDKGILRNADMAGGEIQTGDMGTPPNRASLNQALSILDSGKFSDLGYQKKVFSDDLGTNFLEIIILTAQWRL